MREPPLPRRGAVWVHLIVGWLPVWAVFTLLMTMVHRMPMSGAALIALRLTVGAALLGLLVDRVAAAVPWPHPFRLRFIAIHVGGALLFALAWIGFNSLVESAFRGRLVLVLGPGAVAFLATGVWFYAMIAGIAYARRAVERESRMAALAARSQLAALRAQLHPHFLFNALHTVVQLIPLDPRAAARAAEELAALLRSVLDERRDVVTLAEEWALVQRYLAIESIRFGERLVIVPAIDADVLGAALPSFALQTLVENAVRHAAAPALGTTTLTIAARRDGDALRVSVSDDGAGAPAAVLQDSAGDGTGGSGLRRLRERLRHLYGEQASLQLTPNDPHGLVATLRIPPSPSAAEPADG